MKYYLSLLIFLSACGDNLPPPTWSDACVEIADIICDRANECGAEDLRWGRDCRAGVAERCELGRELETPTEEQWELCEADLSAVVNLKAGCGWLLYQKERAAPACFTEDPQ